MKKEYAVEIRVRYADTDQMAVVYYANYFVWLEIARTEFLRELGVEYRAMEAEEKLALPVTEASCRYKAPARYDDIVLIKTRITQIRNTSFKFEYELLNKKTNQLLATASTFHVFINSQRKPVQIPQKVRALLEKML